MSSQPATIIEALRGLADFGGPTLLVRVTALTTMYLLIRHVYALAGYVAATGGAALLLTGAVTPPVASGHAAATVVAYGMLLLVFLPAVPPPRHRLLTGVLAALIVAVGAARIALDGHRPGDLAAGWLLGALWLAISSAAYGRVVTSTRLGATAREGLAPRTVRALRPAPADEVVLPRPRRSTTRLLAAWAGTVAVLAAAGWLLTTVLADTALTRADAAVVEWIVAHRAPMLDPVAMVGSRLGNTHWILAGTLTAATLLLALCHRWRPVLFLAVVMIGEVTLFLVSSTLIGRPRPAVPQIGPEIPPTASFPSGHVAATICLYAAVAMLTWQLTSRWWRWAAVALAVAAPAYVAAARMYWGVHHPLDIAGSVLLAACWLTACWSIVAPLQAATPRSTPDTVDAGIRP
ncbi:phosphatase PAP2 family protein [Micromonospora sp. NPDC047707]|uniref:phosphatase PAP2 family protein n=1 Tax=Micromonospora sp. NPDC047707 TaxID=3154498 RepID=UPI0034522213